MIQLPKACYVNKFIPKKIFYEKLGVSSLIKEEFVNKVEKITWLYKLSPDTIGISKTDNVEEIQIFQIDIKEKRIPLNVIKTIIKGVQYKILFIIKYDNNTCYCAKIDDIYFSEWNIDIEFNFNAINLEILFENIIKSLINEKDNKKQFNDIIENRKYKLELEKKINTLRQKRKNEKQFNRKLELNKKLNELIKELEDMNNE